MPRVPRFMRKSTPPTFLALALTVVTSQAALSPLCVPPVDGDDIFINCSIDLGSPNLSSINNPKPLLPQIGDLSQIPSSLTVAEYNIDRNGYGGDGSRESGLQSIIDLLHDGSVVPEFDVLLLSEVGRGCDGYGGGNGAEDIAKSFNMFWVYAVEYVQVDAASQAGECR